MYRKLSEETLDSMTSSWTSRMKRREMVQKYRGLVRFDKFKYTSLVGSSESSPEDDFISTSDTTLHRDGKPLKILYMSRGDTGRGRSLSYENIVTKALRRAGAQVVLYGTSLRHEDLETQLSMAYHADVVSRP